MTAFWVGTSKLPVVVDVVREVDADAEVKSKAGNVRGIRNCY